MMDILETGRCGDSIRYLRFYSYKQCFIPKSKDNIIIIEYRVRLHRRTNENTLRNYLPLDYIVCLMVFNATFNNISVISRRSVLLVEETGGPGENDRPVARH